MILIRHHLPIRTNALSIRKLLPLEIAPSIIHWCVDRCGSDIVQRRTMRPRYLSAAYVDL